MKLSVSGGALDNGLLLSAKHISVTATVSKPENKTEIKAQTNEEENPDRVRIMRYPGLRSILLGLEMIFTKYIFSGNLIVVLFNVFLLLVLHNLDTAKVHGKLLVILIITVPLLRSIAYRLFIKTRFRWHTAEHLVINTYESGKELTLGNLKKSPITSAECSTNYCWIIIPVYALLLQVPWLSEHAVISFILASSLAAESIYLSDMKRWARVMSVLNPLQRLVFLAPPTDKMLEIAIQAMNRLLAEEWKIEKARTAAKKE